MGLEIDLNKNWYTNKYQQLENFSYGYRLGNSDNPSHGAKIYREKAY